ncbi:MAG: trans-aconitate 2-methyltransferase [Proteobacteria bacterium]|nr:trans-aconitate 2-methyltransferase [Pseudomonadota bacterium]
MSWSAAQYTKFEAERNRPIADLLAQLPRDAVATAADLGCGPGNSTELLQRRFPDASITGIDSAPDMIAAATKRLPGAAFALGDIAAWAPPERFDLILANASLQWVPDHAALFPRLLGKLAEGGVLAVQMPDNLDEPAHRLMREVAADGPWASKLAAAGQAREARRAAAWYYGLLAGAGARADVWVTIYHHVLAGGARAVVEWFKGTGLRPFLDPLDEDERAAFLARYEAAVAGAYPAMADGCVLLPFPRLFIVATR